MVEAIESLFVPVIIHNNKQGYDAKILKQFNEPSWNNPVVRYLNKSGRDIIARKDGVWTTGQVATQMVAALKAAKKPVPEYLSLVVQENVSKTERATFAMHCYWEGEVNLGGIRGVIETSAGWIGSKEVVNVTYDPRVVTYDKLLTNAQKMDCASTVFAHSRQQLAMAKKAVGRNAVMLPPKSDYRPVRYTEQKYHLRRTALRYLPMTPIQLAKVNAAVVGRKNFRRYLSPRQLELTKKIQTALSKNPERLKQLAAPDDAKDLVAYTDQLQKSLTN
jgi:hypothetical protein